MVVDGPHPNAARQFLEYLQKESTVNRLVELGALEGVEFSDVNRLSIDWNEVMGSFDDSYRWLGETFFR